LSGCARNLKKECAGLVAGQAVLTAEIVSYFSTLRRPAKCQGAGSTRLRLLFNLVRHFYRKVNFGKYPRTNSRESA
jgi:hypothetical protein